MSAANTARGKVTEQMVAGWFRVNGFPGAERTVRTGYRVASRELADGGDLDVCPGLISSVKSLRPANRAERAVPTWLAEAEMQRVQARADVVLLVVRREGTVDVGEWWAWLPLVVLECIRSGDDRHCEPGTWTAMDAAPVRLLVADAVAVLRAGGYGDPAVDVSAVAS